MFVYLGPIRLGNGPHVLGNGLHVLGNGPHVLGNEKVEYKNMGTILFNVLRPR